MSRNEIEELGVGIELEKADDEFQRLEKEMAIEEELKLSELVKVGGKEMVFPDTSLDEFEKLEQEILVEEGTLYPLTEPQRVARLISETSLDEFEKLEQAACDSDHDLNEENKAEFESANKTIARVSIASVVNPGARRCSQGRVSDIVSPRLGSDASIETETRAGIAQTEARVAKSPEIYNLQQQHDTQAERKSSSKVEVVETLDYRGDTDSG